MSDKIEDYQLYKYCKNCGDIIDEDIYDDNNGLCDSCYTEKRTWKEVGFGEYNEE